MNDYKNNGDTTELFGRHPLYVKPETVARFRPKYLGYALSKGEVASLVKKGAIGPTRVSTQDEIRAAITFAWRENRRLQGRI